MRPSLGMTKLEYSHKARLKQCLPARLREASIHSGFYTTSNVGLQRKLGFTELWSSMEDYLNSSTLGRETRGARKRAKKRLRWPASWWRQSSAALLHGRADGQYNWLGDHDYFGLPKARDFIAALTLPPSVPVPLTPNPTLTLPLPLPLPYPYPYLYP